MGRTVREITLQCLNKNKRWPLIDMQSMILIFPYNTHRKDSAFFTLQSFSWINWFLQNEKEAEPFIYIHITSYGLYSLPNSSWQYLHKNLGQASVAVSSADYDGSPAQLRFQEWEIRAKIKRKKKRKTGSMVGV